MKIETAKLLAAGGANAELLAAMADICGKAIAISEIGGVKLVCLGSEYIRLNPITPAQRHNGRGEKPHGTVLVDYQDVLNNDGTRRMIRIFVGVQGFGPILQADEEGWVNCYPHGNCGNNAASGGTWYSPSRARNAVYRSAIAALESRHERLEGDAVHNMIVDADQLRIAPIIAMLCGQK